jgi:hypothetical protein
LFRASSTCATVNGVSARPRPSLSFWEGRAGAAPPVCRGVLAEDASGRTPVTSANPTRLLLPGSGPGAEDRKKLSGKLRSGECLSIGDEGRARTVARGACSYCSPSPGARPPAARVPAISSGVTAPRSAACKHYFQGARRALTARHCARGRLCATLNLLTHTWSWHAAAELELWQGRGNLKTLPYERHVLHAPTAQLQALV